MMLKSSLEHFFSEALNDLIELQLGQELTDVLREEQVKQNEKKQEKTKAIKAASKGTRTLIQPPIIGSSNDRLILPTL